MKDLGAAKKIFGLEIKRDREADKLYLFQRGFVEKILDCFSMFDAKPVSTFMVSRVRFSAVLSLQLDEDKNYISRVPYANVVGSIMYLMVCTRPDLAYGVSVVSRYMANPWKEHW